jgi:hypothetical protein
MDWIGFSGFKSLTNQKNHSFFNPIQSTWKENKGLFGWAVAVKKVVVDCELWKKLKIV